jgi:predicted phage terminase large subunit-like protein
MIQIPIEEKRKTILQELSNDVQKFASVFLKTYLEDSSPPFHRELFEIVNRSEGKNVAIAAPRGHSKSTIMSFFYPLHSAIFGKKKFIVLISSSQDAARIHIEKIKKEIEGNTKIKAFFGNLQDPKKWNEYDIVLKNGCRIVARGAGQNIRGIANLNSRPDLIIMDDVEDSREVQSPTSRTNLRRWLYGDVLPAIDPKRGKIVMIGTVLHDDSLLNRILTNLDDEWITKIYKAIQDDGTSLWPERFPIEYLEKIKKKHADEGMLSTFYMEYQNEPVSEDDCQFKREMIRYYTDDDIKDKKLSYITTCDLAITEKSYGDFSVIITVGWDRETGDGYVREYVRRRMPLSDSADFIIAHKLRYNPDKIGIERGTLEKALNPTLEQKRIERGVFLRLETVTAGNKYERIMGLEPKFMSGKIYIKREMVELIDELLRFPNGKHDDLIDALAYQLQLFVQKPKLHTEVYNYAKKKFINPLPTLHVA